MTNHEDCKGDLIEAREKIAGVWEQMATDNHPDNGNLTELNTTIMLLNNAIKYCDKMMAADG